METGIREILYPRSVAVVGASENKAKFGGRVLYYLIQCGFRGRIVPVNPSRSSVRGLPCVARVSEAPEPVDVAILAVPPAHLLEACRDSAAAGVRCCVIMTTGFAETGDAGRARQDDLVATARAAGMRIVGPNCMGFISPHHDFALTSSLVLERGAPLRGAVGLVSQSGALMVSMYDRARDAGIGFSACASLGNQCDLEICDFLEFLVGDSATRAICLYVEGFRDARRFLDLARAARVAGKPLLMVKAGRTEAGVRAALSHTASLAGSYAVLRAACEECGVVLMDDPDDMIRTADLLLRWPLPQGEGTAGDGIGVLSPSGGGAAIAADRLGERGLRLADPADSTRRALQRLQGPSFQCNPIDLGGRLHNDEPEVAGRLLGTLAADADVRAILVVLTTVPFYEEVTAALGRAALASGKPFAVTVTPGASADGPRRVLVELGCPRFEHLDGALRVLDGVMQARAAACRQDLPPPRRPPGLPSPEQLADLPSGRLTEPEVKRLLAAYGIDVTRETLCRGVDEALSAAADIGYPVALKAVARELVHKSDAGAVRLHIDGEEGLRSAWREVTDNAAKVLPEAALEGVLVQAMAVGELEIIAGARSDPQFGPVVLAGAGGILVELLHDTAVAPAPVDPERARAMLEGLRVWPLLAGWRGAPALDVEQAAEALARLAWLAADLGDRLVEMEINPLLVRRAGGRVIAVDARATLADRK